MAQSTLVDGKKFPEFTSLVVAGTATTPSDLTPLVNVVAGTATASKAVVLDANKAVDVVRTSDLRIGVSGSEVALAATPLELNRTCDVSTRFIAAGGTLSVTEALHDGKIIALDTAAGSVCTLPAATGSGARFRFLVTVTATSNSHVVKVANANDTISGFIHNNDLDGTAVAFYKGNGATSTDDTITMNRTTTGGTIGDELELIDLKANLWFVKGAITCVAGSNIATPFSASV